MCNVNMRRERGCVEDLKDPYIFPVEWGEIRRCPKSGLLENPDLVSLVNIGYSLSDKTTYDSYNNMPNSLLSALDFAREAINFRKEKEGDKNG